MTDDHTSVTCPWVATLAPGGSVTCSATYAVTQADLDAGSVTNTAQGHAFFGASAVDSPQAQATVSADQHPAIAVAKSADPVTYDHVGQSIAYTYVITNAGNVTIDGPLTVTDNLTSVSCPVVATLAPAASATCTATYLITQADLDAGSVTNTARGHASYEGDPLDSEMTDATVTASQSPELGLTKVASPTTYDHAGQAISYTYVLTNTGNVSLGGPVIVTDDLANVSCPALTSVGNNDVTFDPGEAITCSATYDVTQADLDAGSVTNHALGQATFGASTVQSNQAQATVTAAQAPHLSVTKEVQESTFTAIGDNLHYTITATNDGNSTLSAVSIDDPLLPALDCTPAQPVTLAVGGSLTCTGNLRRDPGRPRRGPPDQHRHGQRDRTLGGARHRLRIDDGRWRPGPAPVGHERRPGDQLYGRRGHPALHDHRDERRQRDPQRGEHRRPVAAGPGLHAGSTRDAVRRRFADLHRDVRRHAG